MSDEINTKEIKDSKIENSFNITSIIEDHGGGLSSSRVLMLLWGGGTFLVWSFGAVMGIIHNNYIFPGIPVEVVTIVLGVTGIKCVQRGFEKP